MAKREPSKRAVAFRAWMMANGTNTKQVATKSGVPYTTLASFVQGDTQSLKGENEELIATAYNASAAEIFAEVPSRLVHIIGKVGADTEGTIIQTTGQVNGDMAPLPPGGSRDSVALEVDGHSMRGLAEDGSLIYFETQQHPPTPDMIGYPAIVQLKDDRVLLKRLLRGDRKGRYDLESLNGPTLHNVEIVWAAEITAIIPARQARRIIIRQGEAG